MIRRTVESIMVPLAEYATVSQDATLREAVEALRKSQDGFDRNRYRHRAILIFDEHKKIVGKVNLMAILMGLEPKYGGMLADNGPMHVGFTRAYQKDIIEQFGLWETPLEHLCEKAAGIKVKYFMVEPKEEEMIAPMATLDQAIHQIVMGRHQSLLVVKDDNVVGVLRLTDVFEVVVEGIRACET